MSAPVEKTTPKTNAREDAPAAPVVEISHVSKYFAKVVANKDVSLTVHAGEVVTIIGGNGARKSTLMRCISGLDPAKAGRVLFPGKDIASPPGHQRVALGIAQSPEGPQVFPDHTSPDNPLP